MRGVVLLLAAGSGVRLDSVDPKAFVPVAGVPIVRRAAEAAAAAELVDALVVAVPAECEDRTNQLLSGLSKPVTVVAGRDSRQASAANALRAAGDVEAVAVHDAARVLCPPELFDLCLRELDTSEAVCPAIPASDTIKEVTGDIIVQTLDRTTLAVAQTPQTFRTALYRRAHEQAARDGVIATDDCALVERIGASVRIVPGDDRNIKITTPRDLAIAETLLRS